MSRSPDCARWVIAVAIATGATAGAAALGACAAPRVPPPLINRASGPSTGVRAIDWRNRRYALDEIGSVPVIDGRGALALDGDLALDGELTPETDGAAPGGETGASFRVDPPLFADVDGDGAEDAIVPCTLSTGGTGQFSAIRVYALRAGRVVELGQIPGGDRGDAGIRSVALDGRAIIVERNVLAEGDGLCCPTRWRRERWLWRDGGFAEDVAARSPALPITE